MIHTYSDFIEPIDDSKYDTLSAYVSPVLSLNHHSEGLENLESSEVLVTHFACESTHEVPIYKKLSESCSYPNVAVVKDLSITNEINLLKSLDMYLSAFNYSSASPVSYTHLTLPTKRIV